MSLEENPFVNLFNSVKDAERFVNLFNISTPKVHSDVKPDESIGDSKMTDNSTLSEGDNLYFLENVFLLTTETETNDKLCLFEFPSISLEDIRNFNLSGLVYGRVMLTEDIKEMLTNKPHLIKSSAFETNPMKYLLECYSRLQCICNRSFLNEQDDHKQSSTITPWKCFAVIRDQSLLLCQLPDILIGFSPTNHLSALLQTRYSNKPDGIQLHFYAHLIEQLSAGVMDENELLGMLTPILEGILKKVEGHRESQGLAEIRMFRFPQSLSFFACNATLAAILLKYDKELIKKYKSPEKSVIGGFLSLGSNPKFFSLIADYLDDPRSVTKKNLDDLEASVQRYLDEIQLGMYNLFHKFLKFNGEVKEHLLLWIGDVLHLFKDRNKLWNMQMSHLLPMSSSDNFLLNLQSILLKSFSPVLSNPDLTKLLRIQPTYCSAVADGAKKHRDGVARTVHMREIPGTRLIPSSVTDLSEGSQQSSSSPAPSLPTPSAPAPSAPPPSSPLEERYNLASEMFFMIHSCFNLGFSVVHEKFDKLSKEVSKIQNRYQELLDQGLRSSEAGLRSKERLQLSLPIYYAHQASLTQPELIEKSFQFCVLTANFLVHVAMTTPETALLEQVNRVTFPPPSVTTETALRHVPEFVVQNFHSCLLLLRKINDGFFEVHRNHLGDLLDFILLFMSGPQFIHNPHLRAEMAETLECLFPRTDETLNNGQSIFSSHNMENFYREKLLLQHPNAFHLTSCIISLFVGMELTGQGVEFEFKFRYRQPMYVMFKYLWKEDVHKRALMELASHAEQHLDDVDAPLFLRFINLLINDAIYLLDEALSLMSQIKEKSQQQQDSDYWSNLPANQRQELEATLKHLSLLARFHNIMGLETITTLANLTSVVQSIFTHPVMVDRLAGMLNYFLLHLVGPKKRNLKVKNPEEYKFDPKRILLEICRIYENLFGSEDFLRAISRDGRSYSQDLFEQTSNVLHKIQQPLDRIARFNKLADRIKVLAKEEADEEEELLDAPEDFLDPIMGTLMRDPVLLPSSGKIVDRQTIARHVLSDQSDPFNRQPLTMNMIKPALELKDKIEAWINKNKNRKR